MNTPVSLVLWGGGGHGLAVAGSLGDDFAIIGWFDDSWHDCSAYKSGFFCQDLFCKPFEHSFSSNVEYFVAIGDGDVREECVRKLQSWDLNLASIVAVSSCVDKSAIIGAGSIILPGSVIGVGCHIGDAAIMNSGSILEHQSKLGCFSHLAPGAVCCGEVEVGRYCLIGANATLLPGVKVGDRAIIGAGSVVTKDIPPNHIFAGDTCYPRGAKK